MSAVERYYALTQAMDAAKDEDQLTGALALFVESDPELASILEDFVADQADEANDRAHREYRGGAR